MRIEKMREYTARPDLLQGRVILVTGSGDGIGAALAKAIGALGGTVILVGRTLKKLETVYDAIEADGGPTPALFPMDLEKAVPDDYDRLAEAIEKEYGRLDGLVHNAGLLGTRTPIEQYDVTEWQRVLFVNLTAPFVLTRLLLPLLKASDDGSVIFTSSGVGREGRAYWGAYAVSKFGTEGLMEVLSGELEETTVRANCINPGPTRTSMRAQAYPGENPARLKTPEEVLAPYLYLLGADSRDVTGISFDAQ